MLADTYTGVRTGPSSCSQGRVVSGPCSRPTRTRPCCLTLTALSCPFLCGALQLAHPRRTLVEDAAHAAFVSLAGSARVNHSVRPDATLTLPLQGSYRQALVEGWGRS